MGHVLAPVDTGMMPFYLKNIHGLEYKVWNYPSFISNNSPTVFRIQYVHACTIKCFIIGSYPRHIPVARLTFFQPPRTTAGWSLSSLMAPLSMPRNQRCPSCPQGRAAENLVGQAWRRWEGVKRSNLFVLVQNIMFCIVLLYLYWVILQELLQTFFLDG